MVVLILYCTAYTIEGALASFYYWGVVYALVPIVFGWLESALGIGYQ